MDRDRLKEFVDFVISLDEPENIYRRRTMTMQELINRARAAKEGKEYK